MNQKKFVGLALMGLASTCYFSSLDASDTTLEVAMAKRENTEVSYEDTATCRADRHSRKRNSCGRNSCNSKEDQSTWKHGKKSQTEEYEMSGRKKRNTDK